MKKNTSIILFFCLWLCAAPCLWAQQVEPVRVWNPKEIIQEFGTDYEGMLIGKVYEYRDKGGLWNVLLCENLTTITKGDIMSRRLKAVCLLNSHGGYVDKWTIQDAVLKKADPEQELEAENDIWFWNKYCSFTDMDGDGYIDPLIIYSTSTDDRVQRIRLITVYKGKKYVIRAVECVMDDCRSLRYDAGFKTLPAAVRKKVAVVMERMRKEQNIILEDS